MDSSIRINGIQQLRLNGDESACLSKNVLDGPIARSSTTTRVPPSALAVGCLHRDELLKISRMASKIYEALISSADTEPLLQAASGESARFPSERPIPTLEGKQLIL